MTSHLPSPPLPHPHATLQTHRQSRMGASISFLEFARSNGFFRLWRGGGAVLVGCVPSHAAYFSAYEVGKSRLGVNAPGHHPLAAALTGACATLLHDAVASPLDLVKQRLQLGYYRGIAHCLRSIVEAEGAMSLWRSFPATLAMNIPYAASVVAANESAKVFFKPLLGADSLVTYLASGACAGAVAAAVTTPLDVIKTRMQTNGLVGGGLAPVAPLCETCADDTVCRVNPPAARECSMREGGVGSSSSGSGGGVSGGAGAGSGGARAAVGAGAGAGAGGGWAAAPAPSGSASTAAAAPPPPTGRLATLHVARLLFQEEGVAGLFRGVRARVAVTAPSQAISWATYELVKGLLFRTLGGGGAGKDRVD